MSVWMEAQAASRSTRRGDRFWPDAETGGRARILHSRHPGEARGYWGKRPLNIQHRPISPSMATASPSSLASFA